MILKCSNGGEVVIAECAWSDGAYLNFDRRRTNQGTILTAAELDQVRAELDRIAGAIAQRAADKHQHKPRRAA